MLKVKEYNWLLVLGAVLIVGVLSSVVTASIIGFAIVPNQRVQNAPSVKANSCDADSICEVGKTISTKLGSTSALLITSANKYIQMMDKVSIKKYLILPEILFQNPGENGEIGDPTSDDPRIFVKKSLAAYGVRKTIKQGESTTIFDANGDNEREVKVVKVEASSVIVSVDNGASQVINLDESKVVNGVTVTALLVCTGIGLSCAGGPSATLVLDYNPEYIKTLVIDGVAPNSYTQVTINGKLYA